MHPPTRHLAGLPQRVDEEPPVVVIQEVVLAAIATGHDKVKGVGVLAAKAARHGGPKVKKRILSIICTLTQFS
jgi:hypothetical protein